MGSYSGANPFSTGETSVSTGSTTGTIIIIINFLFITLTCNVKPGMV